MRKAKQQAAVQCAELFCIIIIRYIIIIITITISISISITITIIITITITITISITITITIIIIIFYIYISSSYIIYHHSVVRVVAVAALSIQIWISDGSFILQDMEAMAAAAMAATMVVAMAMTMVARVQKPRERVPRCCCTDILCTSYSSYSSYPLVN